MISSEEGAVGQVLDLKLSEIRHYYVFAVFIKWWNVAPVAVGNKKLDISTVIVTEYNADFCLVLPIYSFPIAGTCIVHFNLGI